MKVIMVKDVPGLGEEGDIREVANGYARNYLFPQGLAVDDSSFNRNRMKEQRKKIEERKEVKRENAQAIAEEISSLTLHLTAAAADNNRLFGAVHEMDIKKALEEKGYEVEKKNIVLSEPIKNLGVYTVPVRLYEKVTAEVKVAVTREGEPVEAAEKSEAAGAAEAASEEAAPVETGAPSEAAPVETGSPSEAAAEPAEAAASEPQVGEPEVPAAAPTESELPPPSDVQAEAPEEQTGESDEEQEKAE
jgi:large subunit ribosomal protein L9